MSADSTNGSERELEADPHHPLGAVQMASSRRMARHAVAAAPGNHRPAAQPMPPAIRATTQSETMTTRTGVARAVGPQSIWNHCTPAHRRTGWPQWRSQAPDDGWIHQEYDTSPFKVSYYG
jgi:hypothetical protein